MYFNQVSVNRMVEDTSLSQPYVLFEGTSSLKIGLMKVYVYFVCLFYVCVGIGFVD